MNILYSAHEISFYNFYKSFVHWYFSIYLMTHAALASQ